MAQLNFTREEIMADHPYAKRQEEVGYLLHGGFDEHGTYLSPRTLHRWPAVRAWQSALKARGWPVIDASVELLKRGNYPNARQEKFLLTNNIGQPLWNSLTITGIIEARGQALCNFEAPDFQSIIVDDISQTATGHLGKGLLYAHGMDEGGDPNDSSVGAHDAMWFAARDLLFGKDAYPIPEVPESIGRPDEDRPPIKISGVHAQLIDLLMNVLMIEVRAESFFSFCQTIMSDPDLFTDRREDALKAAELVGRIRIDEAIHVGYLQTALSEMRSFTFKTVDGGTIQGKEFIDPVWTDMVHWHSVTQADVAREQLRDGLRDGLVRSGAGELFEQFDRLENIADAA